MSLAFVDQWNPIYIMLLGCAVLIAATQVVIVVLELLEKRAFGPVQLGTMITPLCTGYPNLMIGLFGQERLQGDLVLHLNLGNNMANTTLVVGLILFLAGPLVVRAGKGKSKKAQQANRSQLLAFVFLWLGLGLLFWLVRDGAVSRLDGAMLAGLYLVYQLIALQGRGKVSKKKRLGVPMGLLVMVLLVIAALLIQVSLDLIGRSLDSFTALAPGGRLGLFLGLLTVLPESFLLLRLARREGGLGLSGLVGDCLVSVRWPGDRLSAIFVPFETAAPLDWTGPAARAYLLTAGGMLALSGLALFSQKTVPRKVGLFFMAAYGMIWWMTS